jgi:hypothetical protein
MVYKIGDMCIVKTGANVATVGQGASQFFKYLTVAPLLLSLGRNGGTKGADARNVNYGHAMVFAGQGNGWAHATTSGLGWKLNTPELPYEIYRCNNQTAAAQLAGVADKWVVRQKYSTCNAILSGFRSSSFGHYAKKRAESYRAAKEDEEGPEIGRQGRGPGGWFCSMFTIALWQAVLKDNSDTKEFMKLDAKCSSPMTLRTYLHNHPQWSLLPK